MCSLVCGMVHIKDPLLLIEKSSLCSGCSRVFSVTIKMGVRCSSVVRAFAHGAMGHRIDLSWGAPRLV